jgi:ADP-heptose:LPS heptosyltransferase
MYLLSNINSKEKYGFIWNDGHIAVSNKAAEHKLLTGLFDEISRKNKNSYQQEIFEICNLEFSGEKYLLDVKEEYLSKWKSLRQKSNGKKIIGLNTGCGKRWTTRLWPKEYWLKLISDLQKGGFYPVLLGGIDEDELNRFYSNSSGAFYPGTFSLEEFMAVIANCDLIVSAVSLAMHITIGLKKPLVLFNNIFNKYEFELYGRGEILEPDSGCDCYYGNKCKREIHCMFDLLPEKVYNSIVKNL